MVSFKISESLQKMYFRRKFIYLKKTCNENKIFKSKYHIRKDIYVFITKEDEKICRKPLEIYLNSKEIERFEKAKLHLLKDKKCNMKFTAQAEKEFKFLRENPQFNARTLVVTARHYKLSLNNFIDIYNKFNVSPVPTKSVFKVDIFPEKKSEISICNPSKELQNATLDHSEAKKHLIDFKVDRFSKKEKYIYGPSKEYKNKTLEYPGAFLNSRSKGEHLRKTYIHRKIMEKRNKLSKTGMVKKSDAFMHPQKNLESNLQNRNINSVELSDHPLNENKLHVFGVRKEDTHTLGVIEDDAVQNISLIPDANVHKAHSLSKTHLEIFIEDTLPNTGEEEGYLLNKHLNNAEFSNLILKSDSFMDTKHMESNTTNKNMTDVLLSDPPLSETATNVHKAHSLPNAHLKMFIAEDTFLNIDEKGHLENEKMGNTVFELSKHPLEVHPSFSVKDCARFKREGEDDGGGERCNFGHPGADMNKSLSPTGIHIDDQFFSSRKIYSAEESDKSENETNFEQKSAKRKKRKKSFGGHCYEEKKRRLGGKEECPDSKGDCHKNVTLIQPVVNNEIEKDSFIFEDIIEIDKFFHKESESGTCVSNTKPDVINSTEFMNQDPDIMNKVESSGNSDLGGTDDTFELLENDSTYVSQTENDIPEYFLDVPSKDVCLPDDFLINEHVFESSENLSKDDNICPTPPPASSDVLIYPTMFVDKKVHLRNKLLHIPCFKKRVPQKNIIQLPSVFKSDFEIEFNEEELNYIETEEDGTEENSDIEKICALMKMTDRSDIYKVFALLEKGDESAPEEFLKGFCNLIRANCKNLSESQRDLFKGKIYSEIFHFLEKLKLSKTLSQTLPNEMSSNDDATLPDQLSQKKPVSTPEKLKLSKTLSQTLPNEMSSKDDATLLDQVSQKKPVSPPEKNGNIKKMFNNIQFPKNKLEDL